MRRAPCGAGEDLVRGGGAARGAHEGRGSLGLRLPIAQHTGRSQDRSGAGPLRWLVPASPAAGTDSSRRDEG